MNTYKSLKKSILRDKETKRFYDELEPQFKVVRLIIQKRIKKGLTQKNLADKIGTKQSAISRFESGSYSPTIAFLHKVTKALNATIKISIY